MEKNENFLFFEGVGVNFKETILSQSVEGSFAPDKVFIDSQANLRHLFDIPIDSIIDIRYFDATTNRTVGAIGGANWAIPIHMKKEDASVLIDWSDGRFNHSTEFRFVGLFGGHNANKRANTLRNALIKMAQ